MSKESAIAFLTKVDEDPTMQDKIKALDETSNFDVLQDFAASQGYNFTINEMIEANNERKGLSGEDLTQDELEAVAGGAAVKVTLHLSKGSLDISAY
jgi:predicted ribosomally synthesized peptide with nif11-like leader